MTWFTDYGLMIYESLGNFDNVFFIGFLVTIFIFSLIFGLVRKL